MPFTAQAQASIEDILRDHIMLRFETLAATSEALAQTASDDCEPGSEALKSVYADAFDAWVSASHLRFGPTEVEDRAFALAFWPDSRGATPRALATLLAEEDPIANAPDSYRDVSIAARGFYALEFLLYDETLTNAGNPAYHCTLIQTVTSDIASTSTSILKDWQNGYADQMLNPGPDAPYRTDEEVVQEMLKALSTGLQFTSDTRLGRPLGTFDRPRPARAEAYRSGRSASHVLLSLEALRDLAARLATGNADLAETLDAQFADAEEKLTALNDPVFASVADPQSRLKVEVVQQAVDKIRETVTQELGPTLGVAAGFNALDGD
ncbi:Iron-regulated protein A precursor [Litoreibacter arenae DSM 19593]|uniref:Iron-regulated protein A n=2 Tax=Litoreibacter TaxID=947567 RepID=S9QKG5_9RHOB|nr:Iron-regulated protein A precursor [Litoreibacter arenae DSM 19593]